MGRGLSELYKFVPDLETWLLFFFCGVGIKLYYRPQVNAVCEDVGKLWNLSIPMHCKTERLLSGACLKDDRATCMDGAGGVGNFLR